MKVGFFLIYAKQYARVIPAKPLVKKYTFKLKFFFGSCFQGSQKISQGGSIKRGDFLFFWVSIISCRAIKGLRLLELVHRSIPW